VRFAPLNNTTFQNVLMLMVASYDNEGRMLSEISHVGVSNLEPAVYKDVLGGELHLHQDVYVPSAAASLRLAIQDQMSNRLGTVEFSASHSATPGQAESSPELLTGDRAGLIFTPSSRIRKGRSLHN
jgi:hypothetical protein